MVFDLIPAAKRTSMMNYVTGNEGSWVMLCIVCAVYSLTLYVCSNFEVKFVVKAVRMNVFHVSLTSRRVSAT